MKTFATMIAIVLTACLSSGGDATHTREALLHCKTLERACSPDGATCIDMRESEDVCTNGDPEFAMCGDRESCVSTCVMVSNGCAQ
jgi:hypothetical protein